MKHLGKAITAAAMTGTLALAVSPFASAANPGDKVTGTVPSACVGGGGMQMIDIYKDGHLYSAFGNVAVSGTTATITFDVPEDIPVGTYTYSAQVGDGINTDEGCTNSVTVGQGGGDEQEQQEQQEQTPIEQQEQQEQQEQTPIEQQEQQEQQEQTPIEQQEQQEQQEQTPIEQQEQQEQQEQTPIEQQEQQEQTPIEQQEQQEQTPVVPESDDKECDNSGSTCGSSIGGILPAIIVIGGLLWFLNEDGSTYVSSEDRVDQIPTPEEKEKSDAVKEENAEEIKQQADEQNANSGKTNSPAQASAPANEAPAAQGGKAQNSNGKPAPSTPRGIAANTGMNAVAQGSAALAIAAVLGTAAFFMRRKFAA